MTEETPLNGITVLDLTRVLAGPYATLWLGDLGAEVIKVEQPGTGDDSRAYGPPFVGGQSAYFMSVNRNKRSVALDFSTDRGRELLYDLMTKADVILENFRPDTLNEYGLGYEQVRRAIFNPLGEAKAVIGSVDRKVRQELTDFF